MKGVKTLKTLFVKGFQIIYVILEIAVEIASLPFKIYKGIKKIISIAKNNPQRTKYVF